MKSSIMSLVIVFILVFVTGYLYYQNRQLEKKLNVLDQSSNWLPDVQAEEIEVAHFMERMQQFHMKLYYSGVEGNKALSRFYLNEIEEEMNTIASSGVKIKEADISENMRNFGLPQVELFKSAMEKDSFNFQVSFDALTFSCNACHHASGFPFIKIIVPSAGNFPNQDFKP